MPTYDYKCSACGHALEKFQPMSAAALKKCPKCARNTLKRLIGTGAGVIFKGGGFHQTDYRSDSYKADAKKDSSEGGSQKTAEKASDKAKPASDARAEPPSTSESKPAASSKQSKKKSA